MEIVEVEVIPLEAARELIDEIIDAVCHDQGQEYQSETAPNPDEQAQDPNESSPPLKPSLRPLPE